MRRIICAEPRAERRPSAFAALSAVFGHFSAVFSCFLGIFLNHILKKQRNAAAAFLGVLPYSESDYLQDDSYIFLLSVYI